jgi:glutamine amidotransferase
MIVVIDYKAGNLYNVGNALKHLDVDFMFSHDPSVIEKAEKVILPGVGSARAAMDSLEEQGLCDVICALKVPFLGICLGLQLLFERSEEDDTECLGILPGRVKRFDSEIVKVPQIGWNEVVWTSRSGLGQSAERIVANVPEDKYFYFVHSYYAPLVNDYTFGSTIYETEYTSAVAKDNFLGFQFHPERSGNPGLELLGNFVKS